MKVLRILGLVAILAGVFLTPVSAQDGPPGSWTTDFTVLNLDTGGPATVNITRYGLCEGTCSADAGTLITSTVIAAGGSYYYNPINDPSFPAGFGGSVVMSSDKALAATVTVGNDGTGKAYATDAYAGIAQVSDSIFLPIIMGKLSVWNTRIAVQNAGSAATDVTITYIGAGAPAATVVSGLPPNMTALVDQGANAGMSNFNGSALVTASEPLAIMVDEYKSTGGVLVDYVGVPSDQADTTIYMPGYIASGVWQTDFTIVNTAGSTATVSIAFSGAFTGTLNGDIAPNGSAYVNGFLGVYPTGWTGAAPTDGYYGSATVTSSQDIVVVYNEANSAAPGTGNFSVGYVAFPSTAGSMNVAVPLIMNAAYGGNWDTTVSVQVIGGGDANLTMSYADVAGAIPETITDSYTFNYSTPGNKGYGDLVEGYAGGVIITSDVNIVVIADQNLRGGVGDTAAGFPGIPMD